MLWLLTLLGLILVRTLALGGLVLGAISVVSIGFAAVLLGLAVDYAVVHTRRRWRTRNCPCRKSAGPSRRAFCGAAITHDERGFWF